MILFTLFIIIVSKLTAKEMLMLLTPTYSQLDCLPISERYKNEINNKENSKIYDDNYEKIDESLKKIFGRLNNIFLLIFVYYYIIYIIYIILYNIYII